MIKQTSVKKTSGKFLGAIWGQGIGFLTILSLAILSASVFAATLNVQGAKAAPLCYPLKGTGQSVLVSGVANSGVLKFTLPPAYQGFTACESDAGNGDLQLQGWIWDTNLGWISLYCPAGGNQLNLGQQCSNNSYTDEYGVKVDAYGVFSGYAWSDNAGWISFDNGAFSQVRVDVGADSPCAGSVYGYTPPIHNPACTPNGGNVDQGHQFTFAWSDSVGWLDFSGLTFPGQNLSHVNVTVTLNNDPSTLNKKNAPMATGSDPYFLKVSVLDDQMNPVPDQGQLDVKVNAIWKDTVKKIQTDPNSNINNGDCSVQNSAVQKPCAMNSFTQEPGSYVYNGTIISVAPTSNMNGLDTNSDGIVDFPYESFIFGPAQVKQLVQPNDLQLSGVSITVKNKTTGKCIYPDASCSINYQSPAYANPSDTYFKFKPATEVTTLALDSAPNADVISFSQAPQKFDFVVQGGGQVALNSGLDPAVPAMDFLFDNDQDGSLTWGIDTNIWNDINGVLGQSASFNAGPAYDPQEQAPASANGLYIYSVVSEQGGLVQYYSNKLARGIVDLWGNYIVPPVAVFRGNVYSGSLSSGTASSQALRSIGDPSTKKFKDSVVKNVYKIIGGITTQPLGDVTLSSGGSSGFGVNGGTVAKLMNDNVYYAKGNVHISGNQFTWNGEKTIIVIGGSVYIDTDLKPNSSSGRLGIIVLKDQAALASVRAKQGNIYINKNVKQIYANMVADGAVFPYDSAAGVSANGEPKFVTVDSKRLSLNKQQLFMQGNIVSMNTIGGANHTGADQANAYVLGNGQLLYSGDSSGLTDAQRKLRAELYDLNYLREFTGYLKIDQNGKAVAGNQVTNDPTFVLDPANKLLLKPDGTPKTAVDAAPGYLYDPVVVLPGIYLHATNTLTTKDLAATYIYFDPPTSTLPGFGVDGASFFQNLAQ